MEGEEEGDEGGYGVHRDENSPPPQTLANPSGGSILKAALSLHGRTGWAGGQGGSICDPAGQHRELHVTQLSMTTRARDGRGEVRERGRTWKSSAAVRERSVGAQSQEQSTQ